MHHREWPTLGRWIDELEAASLRNRVSIAHVGKSARANLWDQGYTPIDALLMIAAPVSLASSRTPPKSGPTP